MRGLRLHQRLQLKVPEYRVVHAGGSRARVIYCLVASVSGLDAAGAQRVLFAARAAAGTC